MHWIKPVHPHRRGDYFGLIDVETNPLSVHPHRRGDYAPICSNWFRINGSPPQAWGLLAISASNGSIMPVHPHRRGDYFVLRWVRDSVYGSPPQAWGLREYADGAGHGDAVHPHRRGDYAIDRPRAIRHARFTPTGVGITGTALSGTTSPRFTPTGVGITMESFSEWIQNERFTPTGVGITVSEFALGVAFGGSPPQAWGLRCAS